VKAPMCHSDDYPRSMTDKDVRCRRKAMRRAAHIAPLARFAAKLRKEGGKVPDFDPLDGGIHAFVLFLFEKPGPKTVGTQGSGFISSNNNDQTAAATFSLMLKAGFCSREIVIWNIVPWWNGTIKCHG
jgi:hypothetical protein